MQKDLYAAAKQRLKDNTVLANSIDEVEVDSERRDAPKKAAASS